MEDEREDFCPDTDNGYLEWAGFDIGCTGDTVFSGFYAEAGP